MIRYVALALLALTASGDAMLRGNKQEVTPEEISDIVRRQLKDNGNGNGNGNGGQICEELNFEEMALTMNLDVAKYSPA
jgi:hypothetical protein